MALSKYGDPLNIERAQVDWPCARYTSPGHVTVSVFSLNTLTGFEALGGSSWGEQAGNG